MAVDLNLLRTPPADPSKLLTADDCCATTLLVYVSDRYYLEWLTWHPRTLRRELEDAGISLSSHNFDKLMAARLLVTTNFFWRDLVRFIHLVNALCGHGFDPSQVDPPETSECAWAITEALLLDPPEEHEKDNYFCDDIRHYLGQRLHEEGFLRAPDILGVALNVKSHDSGMYNDVTRYNQQCKEDEIHEVIHSGLVQLRAQLAALPLQHGNVKDFLSRLDKTIAKQQKGETP